MKVLVIGLGSMGRRRIRLLQEHGSHEITGVDTAAARRRQAEEELHITAYENSELLLSQGGFDCAFICCAPLAHHRLIMQCLRAGLHVFTEINLVTDGYEEMTAYAREHHLTLFLSSTFNYRLDIRWMQEKIHNSALPVHYIYHVGQYLPDWHPWENYQDFFVHDRRTNGVREIMAIELPWLYQAFGEIESIEARAGNISRLEINFPDSCMVLLTHSKGHQGMICFDIVARKARRSFEAFNEDLHVFWEGKPETLAEYDPGRQVLDLINVYAGGTENLPEYNPLIIEDAYAEEIRAFFQTLAGADAVRYTFQEDEKVLQWIDRIEKAGKAE